MLNINNMKKLKSILDSDELEFVMEAHSGLSAVIAEEAGFRALWASGLSLSASTGCKDRNELDLSEICTIIRQMSDHTSTPILVDGDTGGADLLSSKNMVRRLAESGASGVCIEDKVYPKHNSFLDNSSNDLADPHLHASKIKVMKEEIPEFVVIARLESFIAGAGLDDAMKRAIIYSEAGADAILVHSKKSTAEDITAFMKSWNSSEYSNVPIVIVPTKYYRTPTDQFRELGISTVIWANHNLRSSIKAMQETCQMIQSYQSLENVERFGKVVPVSEVFRLQRDEEAVKIETDYCSSFNGSAVLLCGGRDKDTGVYKTLKCPKDHSCSYLCYLTRFFNHKVNEISVITGVDFAGQACLDENKKYFYNDMSDDVSETSSLITANSRLLLSVGKLPIYVSYGDVYFKNTVFSQLNEVPSDYDIIIAAGRDTRKVFNRTELVNTEDISCQNMQDNLRDFKNIVVTFEDPEGIIPSEDRIIFAGLLKIQTLKGLTVLREKLKCHTGKTRLVEILNEIKEDYPDFKIGVVQLYDEEWSDEDEKC